MTESAMRSKVWRANNPERVRQYAVAYKPKAAYNSVCWRKRHPAKVALFYQTHKQEIADYCACRYLEKRDVFLKRGADYRKKHPEKHRENSRKYYQANPEKTAAAAAVRAAARAGKIIKPAVCSLCGVAGKRLHGHHWSYLPVYRFDVEWLCPSCHMSTHQTLNSVLV